jgi:hypothetical protein
MEKGAATWGFVTLLPLSPRREPPTAISLFAHHTRTQNRRQHTVAMPSVGPPVQRFSSKAKIECGKVPQVAGRSRETRNVPRRPKMCQAELCLELIYTIAALLGLIYISSLCRSANIFSLYFFTLIFLRIFRAVENHPAVASFNESDSSILIPLSATDTEYPSR